MRRILLALIMFACVAPAAEAAPREQRGGQTASRSAQATPPQARTQTPAPRQAKARAASRQAASNLRPGDVRTSTGGVLVRGASAATVSRDAPSTRARPVVARNAVAQCTQRNGRNTCAPARSSAVRWQSGLPVANYSQRECPEGTFATLARGHDDVVRCMPF